MPSAKCVSTFLPGARLPCRLRPGRPWRGNCRALPRPALPALCTSPLPSCAALVVSTRLRLAAQNAGWPAGRLAVRGTWRAGGGRKLYQQNNRFFSTGRLRSLRDALVPGRTSWPFLVGPRRGLIDNISYYDISVKPRSGSSGTCCDPADRSEAAVLNQRKETKYR